MAKHMGLKVVAEGVETEPHYNFLKNLKVDYLQGYWYARPMHREKIETRFLKPALAEFGKNQAPVISLYTDKKDKNESA